MSTDGLNNTRQRLMIAAIGPNGEIISYPLNMDCVKLGIVEEYNSATSLLKWHSAWDPDAVTVESFVYLSNEGQLAGLKCAYISGDMIVAYRKPKAGQQMDQTSLIYSDWIVFSGGGGDASCAIGTTLYASRIVITEDCTNPEANNVDHIILEGDKLIVAPAYGGSNTVDLKTILKAEIIPLKLCDADGSGTRIIQALAIPEYTGP